MNCIFCLNSTDGSWNKPRGGSWRLGGQRSSRAAPKGGARPSLTVWLKESCHNTPLKHRAAAPTWWESHDGLYSHRGGALTLLTSPPLTGLPAPPATITMSSHSQPGVFSNKDQPLELLNPLALNHFA
ncbi:unnamed protein product [Pleuronectes platessa]|uniref:Uncharacterized protein n=1 Tax=Pleuronectes platessa TaxID=8262 RepID=A0A9N7TW13_PLEPL|nr:unnamed protein product [Pleuronectes platessa]